MTTQRRAFVTGAAVLALLLSALCATTGAATTPGIPDLYGDGYRTNAFKWPGVTRNHANGLPMVSYRPIGPQWNYVTVALYGLQRWSAWVHDRGGTAARAEAIAAADFLVARQDRGGAWRYAFAWTYRDGALSQTLPAGWVAAQAQGNAISLLSRMYAATGERRYLAAAIRALLPFERSQRAGGLAVTLAGHTLLAGFPTRIPTLTLEDYEGALIGIADLARYSHQAQALLSRLLPDFYWSLTLYTSPSGLPYDNLGRYFTAQAAREIDPTSAQFCVRGLSALVAGYPSAQGERALGEWTDALNAEGLGA